MFSNEGSEAVRCEGFGGEPTSSEVLDECERLSEEELEAGWM